MAYITPKENWVSGDSPLSSDLNRIEGNTHANHDAIVQEAADRAADVDAEAVLRAADVDAEEAARIAADAAITIKLTFEVLDVGTVTSDIYLPDLDIGECSRLRIYGKSGKIVGSGDYIYFRIPLTGNYRILRGALANTYNSLSSSFTTSESLYLKCNSPYENNESYGGNHYALNAGIVASLYFTAEIEYYRVS